MKLASIFFTASAVYIGDLSQIYGQTSEKYEALLQYFSQRVQNILEIYLKYTYKSAGKREICGLPKYFYPKQ